MRNALLLIFFVFVCLCSLAQPDTSRNKEIKKEPEAIKQRGKKLFFENNKTPQKVLEDFKINQAQQKVGILEQDPQKKQAFDQITRDTRESMLKASLAPAIIIDEAEVPSPSDNIPRNKRFSGPAQFDSRIELRELDPLIDWQLKILQNAGSVGLIVRKETLQDLTDSIMRLAINQTLEKKYNLCPAEAFAKQPVIGEGTAFIIDDSLLMTASHVLDDSLTQYAIVFGYELVNKVGSYETDIPVTNIFDLTSFVFKDDDLDVAIVSVNRRMNRPALHISRQPVNLADKVYAIGHPSGLPQKVSLNASVQTNDHLQYFYTTLDAFQGSSGSPVFNVVTHQVIGILVSGEVDFRFNGSCNTVTICRIPFCKGEKVIRIADVVRNMN